MNEKRVITEVTDQICWVWLQDPKGLNTMGRVFFQDLEKCLNEIDGQLNELTAVIFATKDKNFSVGLDIKECAELGKSHVQELATFATRLFNRITLLDVPTLALLKGHSIGGALEMTLGCDFRFSLIDANFSLPAAKIGFFNPGSVCFQLPKLIGMPRAKNMLMNCKSIDGARAYRWGLVNELAKTEEDLIKLTHDWIHTIRSLDQVALKSTKKLLEAGKGTDLKSYVEKEIKEIAFCFMRDEPILRMQNFWKK